jgi:formamidopyrimidine-DNA glycosylase
LLTIDRDEVLYQAKIHPEQYSNSFNDAQVQALHESLINVCTIACETLADSSQFPEDWLMKHRWNKGKKDANVLPNGAKIIHLKVGGRTSAVVPSVQKKTGPVAGDVDENENDNEKPQPKGRKKKAAVKEEDSEEEEKTKLKGRKRKAAVKEEETDEDEVEEEEEEKPKPAKKAANGTSGVKKEEAKTPKTSKKSKMTEKTAKEETGRRPSRRGIATKIYDEEDSDL